MITTLTDTTASAVDKKMAQMRETFGANAIGRVLTLIIVATGEEIDVPVEAASHASHEHPCRVIVVDADEENPESGLDAEIRLGRDAGAGEIIILRAKGRTMDSLDTLVMPLLLPDAPIVTWWPDHAPSSPVHDVLGRMAQRRITDVAACADPLASLKRLRRGYASGDSDMAWSRLTRWRGLLATAVETPPVSAPTGATVTGPKDSAAVVLLASWLEEKLGIEVALEDAPAGVAGADGPQSVEIVREDGTIRLHRISEDALEVTLPGEEQAAQQVPVPVRTLDELLAEELRRLDPDEVYGEVLAHAFTGIDDPAAFASGKPEPTTVVLDSADALVERAASDTAATVAGAIATRDTAHLVVTGGGLGTRLVQALPEALRRAEVDTSRLHVWWGDERFVHDGSEERNDTPVLDALLRDAAIPGGNVHRMPSSDSGMSLDEAAAWYGSVLDRSGGDAPFHTRGEAFFDVLLLGVGPDAHVASLFPEHPDQKDISATAVPVRRSPKPPAERISLSWPALNSARRVLLLVSGEEKAGAVARSLGDPEPWTTPASAVRGLDSTTWYLDRGAASQLPSD
ncbi:6-phosphogluconolactonase [Brachybacterium sp. EF45031]|uniref:6-phosphogluconolactonase n=1 Tax=Brachybacterium sillae TaxID=2810536 RepID=UPI00217E6109|nr:6-phosphogluconolactonase [Brachybacterium sillae]MCS6710602.1 6-phosphogluconolactonase [Brachybacterium sillae]